MQTLRLCTLANEAEALLAVSLHLMSQYEISEALKTVVSCLSGENYIRANHGTRSRLCGTQNSGNAITGAKERGGSFGFHKSPFRNFLEPIKYDDYLDLSN